MIICSVCHLDSPITNLGCESDCAGREVQQAEEYWWKIRGPREPVNRTKGVDMSGSEWRVICCRRGARAIDSILRMQQYGEGPKYENSRSEVEPGELCSPTVQLSAKTCQLQMFLWTEGSRSRPTGRLVTRGTCPYGIWTHVTICS